jgi:hypothetical protein
MSTKITVKIIKVLFFSKALQGSPTIPLSVLKTVPEEATFPMESSDAESQGAIDSRGIAFEPERRDRRKTSAESRGASVSNA